MRVSIHLEGSQLTPHLRAFAESRLLAALRPFRERIASAVMTLRIGIDRFQPDTTGCDVVVTLHLSGEVRAGAQEARMEDAIDRATERIRESVERAVSRPLTASAPPVVGSADGHRALEIVLDGNRISQHQRELLERPEHYLRPLTVREYWRPSDVEHDEPTEERAPALAIVR